MPEVVFGNITHGQKNFAVKVETTRRQIFIENQEIPLASFEEVRPQVVWLTDNHRIAFDRLFEVSTETVSPTSESVLASELPGDFPEKSPSPISAAVLLETTPENNSIPAPELDFIKITKFKSIPLATSAGIVSLVAMLIFGIPAITAAMLLKVGTVMLFTAVLAVPVLVFLATLVVSVSYNLSVKVLGGIKFTTD